MNSIKLHSPAKINLFLKVVGRRPDGYHDLESLFQTVSLYDTLHITIDTKDNLTCSSNEVPADQTNLVIKALELFRAKTGINFCVKIALEKKIPIQAGLGGGSGNAATMLWGLNQLHGKPVCEETLQEWSAELGSDVPFFFSQGTALCKGRGEHVQNLSSLPHQKLWIVKPEAGLSTPAVFKALNFQELPVRDTQKTMERILRGDAVYFNDLEVPAFRLCPELEHLKNQLYQSGSHAVCMTGTGTAMYCVGDKPLRQLPGISVHEVSFVNRSSCDWY